MLKSNLVQRLRGIYISGDPNTDEFDVTRDFSKELPAIHAEAADRIEILTVALKELADTASQCDGWESFPSDPLDKAHEALNL